ncbi:hypothetical protein MATL_G00220640 [Megalops atlanticus]|uniref:Uncharacterized protein n=1 Tax=Megalops atlanticus TaxID=7932 RepID=A0A9D3PED2_MEGAT|nr:hypothetical protein MATL_G00220640 [Megalops atlanticus]
MKLKSGFQKRKQRRERERKLKEGRQLRTSFFQKTEGKMQAVEDNRLFCELCRLYFSDSCPTHGLPHFVRDSAVSEGAGQVGGACRAVCTLPQCLVLVEQSQDPAGELGVFAQALLPQGWIFGPYEGERLLSQQSCTKYSWAVKDKGFFFYVDASDESKSNWMRYVSCASSLEEQNLTVFQYRSQIYYRVCRPIPAGTELRVWIGREYATMLGLQQGDRIKFEFGEKEILMKIFQDIQVVSVRGGGQQAAADGKDDSGGSPSDPQLGGPGPQQHPDSSVTPNRVALKFNFVKGAESLVSLSRAQSRYWTFFGFESDQFGQFLDKTKIMCKLCGGRLAYSGNTTNLRQHLIYKHRHEFNQLMESGVAAVGQASSVRAGITFSSGSPKVAQRSPQQPAPPSGPGGGGGGSASVSSSVGSKAPPLAPAAGPVAPPPVPSLHTTNSIADFLIRDLLPPETVDGEGFRQLMSTLLPSYEVPSGEFLAQTALSEAYRQGKARWGALLQDALGAAAGRPSEKSEDVTLSPAANPDSARGQSGSVSDSSSAFPAGALSLSSPSLPEVPARCRVAVSGEVWRHGWHSGACYVTLSAHFVDEDFTQHNLTLASERLGEAAEEAAGEGGRGRAAEARARAMAREWGISEPSFLLLGGERGLWGERRQATGGEDISTPHSNAAAASESDDSAASEESCGLGSESVLSADPHSTRVPGPDSKPRSREEGRGVSARRPPVSCVFTVLRECVEELLQRPDVSGALRRCKALLSQLLTVTLPEKNASSPTSSAPSLPPRLRELLGDPATKSLLKSWTDGGLLWNTLYSLIQTLCDNQHVFSQMLEGVADGTQTSGSSSVGAGRPQVTSHTDTPEREESPSANARAPPPTFPEPSDWSLLQELCALLRPLGVACSTLAGERFPRLSLVKPVLTSLLSRHFAVCPDDSAFRRAAKRAVRDRLAGRYSDPEVQRALNLVCALDPRLQGLEFLEAEERAETFSRLKKEAVRLAERQRPGAGVGGGDGGGQRKETLKRASPSPSFGEAQSSRKKTRQAGTASRDPGGQTGKDSPQLGLKGDSDLQQKQSEATIILDDDEDAGRESDREASRTPPSSGPSSQEKSLSDMEFLLGGLCASRPQASHCSLIQQVEREVAIFRAESGAELGEDPLLWWRARAAQLPLLARVARIYLAAPATAGHAPRLFSQGGGEGGAMFRKRANIPPEFLDQLLFLHDNRLSVTTPESTGPVKK